MFIKKWEKQLLKFEGYIKVRQFIKYIRDEFYYFFHKKIQYEKILNVTEFIQKRKHVFFGYYDIQNLNQEENLLLVHVAKKNANTKHDTVELGFYDLINKRYCNFAQSRAWCWQQGARLRWNPLNDSQVLYNDIENEKFVTRVFDINEKKLIKTIPMALYDVDKKMKYGISVNFARIQRLRPGYGYNSLKDKTIMDKAPKEDGLFLVDIENGKEKLIISLKELAEKNYNLGDNYINHVSIAPDGEKFMFFHIWTTLNKKKWKTRLYVSNIDGSKLKLLEDDCELVSHYDWIDNQHIIITSYNNTSELHYFIYSIDTGDKQILDNKKLRQDGHPSMLADGKSFISDTYPIKYDAQTLFYYNITNKKYITILKIYSNPNLYAEKRCDLHPRLSATERYITIDSTVKKGSRRVILIDNWKKLINKYNE